MDPRAQDVLRCDLCKVDPLQNHCELCHIDLCANCVGKHLSDSLKRHRVVLFTERRYTSLYPACLKHADKHCELYCDKCDLPICTACVSSGKHKGHTFHDVLEQFTSKQESLRKYLEELETRMYPEFELMVSDGQIEKAVVEMNYGKLITAADQQGEVWHREITYIVNQRKLDIEEMKSEHLVVLDNRTDQLKRTITDIKQAILDLKQLLDSNDVALTYAYKSRNGDFKNFPPKIKATLPTFSPPTINTEKLNEMFGSLSPLSITTARQLLTEPRLAATIDTGYKDLYSVTCLSDKEIWTCGDKKIMKLHNLQGNLLKSIQTQSGDWPRGLAVTRDGCIVYTDTVTRTINIMKKNHLPKVIKLKGWIPVNVCSTSADDLLVIMVSDGRKQYKVVRYSGSTETQTIQFDDQGRPLYSSGGYISENRNLDICVADREDEAVVVVNQSGSLRFRYTGLPSNTKKSFNPVGIATDSESHILIADYYNDRVHIVDQDGQFLSYIDNCHLHRPLGLCVDSRDNIFVTEWGTSKVKKIQYM
ncbi:probable E3 ubiquitin-protein ligase MID2 [Ostrea edulis]|uniref:probable E3 ubiquitin-protein ligase MID2 n=1 Tax=Ostrea edulis TaxID=37623 RepID=UPI0024AECC19|nr:probable E3 ubiquitin-protein ligase MID2 [Ostrea edulis]